MDPAELASDIQIGNDLVASKYYLAAGTVVLVYDYLLTLSDEIQYGWKGNKSWIFALFIANRYLSLVYSVWVNIAFLLPSYSVTTCDRTAFISLLWTGVATAIAQTFLTLRIYALLNKKKRVLYPLSIVIAVQFIYAIILTSLPGNKGIPIPSIQLEAFHACILFPMNQQADIGYLGIALAFDGLVFFITLTKSITSIRSFKTSNVIRVLVKDSIIYFFVIFSHGFIWLMFIATARSSLKYLPGQAHILIMPVMINRLTLSLREASRAGPVGEWGIQHFQTHQSSQMSDRDHTIPMLNLSGKRGERSI